MNTLRDHILDTTRDLYEEKEDLVRLTLAWASLDKQLLEAREQRDELLQALKDLCAAATEAYMSDQVPAGPFIRAGDVIAKVEGS